MRPTRHFLAFLVLATACATSTPSSPDAAVDVGADVAQDALVEAAPKRHDFPACDPTATTQRVSFVHVNDLHASYTPLNDGISPVARIMGFLQQSRAENPYTLFTDGGDDYEKGSVAELLSQGHATREIVRAMQFDVRVIGNHDYAWSEEEVLANSQDPVAHVLSSNIHYVGNDSDRFGAVEFTVMQIGCVKVGFFGLTSQPWDSNDNLAPGDFYPNFPSNYDYVAVATDIVAKHRKDVDLLIAVDHIGLEADQILVQAVPGIDAILSGHSHSFTLMPLADSTFPPVVQSGAFCQHVIRLDVDIDLKTRKIKHFDYETAGLGMDSGTPADAVMNATVQAVVRKYAPEWDKSLATLAGAVGQADAARLAAQAERAVLAVDAALVDVHTTWSLWLPGELTQQQLAEMFKVEREPPGSPGFNAAYTAKITGVELQKLQHLNPDNWAFVGPASIDPQHVYTLGLQKRTALNPDSMPDGVTVTEPKAAMEMWEVLDKFARARSQACQYLDVEDKLPTCP